MRALYVASAALLLGMYSAAAQHSATVGVDGPTIAFGGVTPSLTATADSSPIVGAGLPKRSECGIGGLMPWADRLYMISYLSVPFWGGGTGLYEIDPQLGMKKIRNHSSVYANRMMHHWTDQIIIGPYVIDAARNVKTFTGLLGVRVGGMAEHLFQPESLVYFISMEGILYEGDLNTMEVRQIADVVHELGIPVSKDPHTTGQCYPHFKAALTVHSTTDGHGGLVNGSARGGILYVASNGFNQQDYVNGSYCGRLGSWDGKTWTSLEKTAFYEIAARKNYGRAVYATGWDRKSAILKVRDAGSLDAPKTTPGVGTWVNYRLPKASHAFDHGWQTEWPRIREVETERYLLDHMGMFYELSPLGWAGSTFGIRPISQHLRVVPDFASFRGLLVMGGNQVSSIFDNNIVTGQAQSGLWLGKTDDLWSWGKPQGWGAVWLEETIPVKAISDPFLMTGFDHKSLHLSADCEATALSFAVELDPIGNAVQTGKWRRLTTLTLNSSDECYIAYVFPTGISAHWVRIRDVTPSSASVTAHFGVTAHFTYS